MRQHVSYDTETAKIQPGLLTPELVCGSLAKTLNVQEAQLLTRNAALKSIRQLLEDEEVIVTGANIAYDFGVVSNVEFDLLKLIFKAYASGRVHDVQIAQALDAIANGHLFKDPRTGAPIRGKKGKPGRYSLETCVSFVLGRLDAKNNDFWRQRYWILKDVPQDLWPEEARQYPKDDASNTLEVALAQKGLLPDTQEFSNMSDLAVQCETAFAMHLGAIWGIRTSRPRVAALEEKVETWWEKFVEQFQAIGFLRPNLLPDGSPNPKAGKEDSSVVKRAVAVAYGASGVCETCKGSGRSRSVKKVECRGLKNKNRFVGCAGANCFACEGYGVVNKVGGEIICPGCDGTGLDLNTAPTLPLTKGGGVSSDRDTLSESGDDDLQHYGENEAGKIRETYLPFLREGFHRPINLRPNVLVESGRTSYDGLIQLLPRSGGVRECFEARPGYVYCLMHGVHVQMADGTSVAIEDLVRGKSTAEVLSLNSDGHVVPAKIVAWHRTVVQGQKWVRIRTEMDGSQCRGLIVTPDHKVHLRRGIVEAATVVAGDEIKISEKALTKRQEQAALGTLIGDCVLVVSPQYRKNWRAAPTAYLQGSHCKHSWLAEHKIRFLSPHAKAGPEVPARRIKIRGNVAEATAGIPFRTHNMLQLRRLMGVVYDDAGKRRISREVLDRMGDIGLAWWFMDNGTLMRGHESDGSRGGRLFADSINICAQGFCKEDVDLAADWLETRFGWPVRVSTNKPSDRILYFNKDATYAFCHAVAKYIYPEMRYKLPRGIDWPAYEPLEEQSVEASYARVSMVEEYVPPRGSASQQQRADNRYCVTVEGNHNFFTTYGLVSNCSVDYGALELCTLAQVCLWLFGQSSMSEAINTSGDPGSLHTEFAARMIGTDAKGLKALVAAGDKTAKGYRQAAKPCFHPDTEILTRKRGWVKVGDLTMQDEVASVVPREERPVFAQWAANPCRFAKPSMEVVWTKPTRLTKRQATEGLLHFKNESIDLRVTPDHRMLAYGSTRELITVEARDFGKQRGWFNAGLYKGGSSVVDERLLRLAVATHADGNYIIEGVEQKRVRFDLSKQRKINRLSSLLYPREYERSLVSNGKHKKTTTFKLAEDISSKVKALLDSDKTLPWSWLELTSELREAALDEAAYWDSHKNNKLKCYLYSSTLQKNTDVLQALASITNRKARHTESTEGQHGLSVKTKYDTRGGNLTTTALAYEGDVYCLSVPSSYVLVRDGGVPVIAGQCNFGLPGGMGAVTLVLTNRKRATGSTEGPNGRSYDGIRFCILVGGAKACGVEKITEWKGRSCPPVCRACVELVEFQLKPAWHEQWPEMREYFSWITRTLDRTNGVLPCLGPWAAKSLDGWETRAHRVRGGLSFTSGANSLFQSLAADGAKDALRCVVREAYTDEESCLFGTRPVMFVHDEIFSEMPEEKAHLAGPRKAQIMIEAMRRWTPDVTIVAEPALMRYWYKDSKTLYDSTGKLVVWEPKEKK